ncbi:MAG: hypothetical protein GPJ54_11900 [Candidatus Heimdallarchaeota archaeon]|nr:hypothetical protein [Candidatus Heimdallarchaeota archaeon]
MENYIKKKELSNTYKDHINIYFPSAVRGDFVTKEVNKILHEHDFTEKNTLFGTSCCPDEVNEFVTNFKVRWGNKFPLAGLGGMPFTGMTGFNAFLSHMPDNGNLFVLFASHIGIDEHGEMGIIRRKGMKNETPACGSVIAAYNNLLNRDLPSKDDKQSDEWDLQQNYIEIVIERSFSEIRNSSEPLLKLTEVVYNAIYNKILKIIPSDCEVDIVLFGGIQINTSLDFYDYFLIKEFKLINKKHETELNLMADLFNRLR